MARIVYSNLFVEETTEYLLGDVTVDLNGHDDVESAVNAYFGAGLRPEWQVNVIDRQFTYSAAPESESKADTKPENTPINPTPVVVHTIEASDKAEDAAPHIVTVCNCVVTETLYYDLGTITLDVDDDALRADGDWEQFATYGAVDDWFAENIGTGDATDSDELTIEYDDVDGLVAQDDQDDADNVVETMDGDTVIRFGKYELNWNEDTPDHVELGEYDMVEGYRVLDYVTLRDVRAFVNRVDARA